MYIKNIKIENFRNYDKIDINLHNKVNIIYGENAAGKTNLLESIYVLGLTKSHRSFIDNNLIKEGSVFFSVKGTLIKENLKYELEIRNSGKKKTALAFWHFIASKVPVLNSYLQWSSTSIPVGENEY